MFFMRKRYSMKTSFPVPWACGFYSAWVVLAGILWPGPVRSATDVDPLRISSVSSDGTLGVEGAFTNGVIVIEHTGGLGVPSSWQAAKNIFTTSRVAQTSLTVTGQTA